MSMVTSLKLFKLVMPEMSKQSCSVQVSLRSVSKTSVLLGICHSYGGLFINYSIGKSESGNSSITTLDLNARLQWVAGGGVCAVAAAPAHFPSASQGSQVLTVG